MKRHRLRSPVLARAAAALVSLTLVAPAGCYKQVAVQPTELPKLNGAFAEAVGSHQVGNTTVTEVAVSSRDVLTPDDRVTQVKGRFDLIVDEKNGDELVFEHPVMSQIERDMLTVRGGNRGATSIALADVKETKVTQFDYGASMAVGLLVGVLATAAIVGITFAAVSH